MPKEAFVACMIIIIFVQAGCFIGSAHLAHKDNNGNLAGPIVICFMIGLAFHLLVYQLMKVVIG